MIALPSAAEFDNYSRAPALSGTELSAAEQNQVINTLFVLVSIQM